MKEVKIYILIPVYNVEAYLEACLQSILSQNYSAYEVILVNDGSTDRSGAICDRYAAEHERVHVIHQKNSGQLAARSAAVASVRESADVRNTYCIFVDSDDELMPNALATIGEKLRETSCDMLIYGYEKFNADGVFYTTLAEGGTERLIDDMGTLFREAIIEHTYNSLCRKAVKTELLFYDVGEQLKHIRMGEDLLQSLELYRQAPKTRVIPDILYRYRVNPSSITQTFAIKRFTDELSSRAYCVSLIRSLGIWCEEDFRLYLSKCLSVVAWDIRTILAESPSRRESLSNLQILYEHPFVQDFCLKGISAQSNVWLREFSKRHFRRLWIMHKLSQMKNRR